MFFDIPLQGLCFHRINVINVCVEHIRPGATYLCKTLAHNILGRENLKVEYLS